MNRPHRTAGSRGESSPGKLAARASLLFFAAFCLAASACSLGPAQLRGNRLDYNRSVQESDAEELLLNLVRMRYYETPYFMQVSSISSSFNYTSEAGANGGFNQGQEAFVQYPVASFLPFVKGSVSESPTITFSPLLGEKFVSQLLTNITPSRFWFLHRAGWEMSMLLNLLVTRIGVLHNPAHFQMTTPAAKAQRSEFLKFVALVQKISDRGDFGLLYQDPTPDAPYSLTMQFRFSGSDEADEAERLLGAKIARQRIEDGTIFSEVFFSPSLDLPGLTFRAKEGLVRPIALRNFIGVLVYLVNGVEVPKADLEKGIVKVNKLGRHYNDPNNFIIVESSDLPPTDDLVSVKFHGSWFYIRDADFSSKRTFSFVAVLLALQSGNVSAATPLLTLPVNK